MLLSSSIRTMAFLVALAHTGRLSTVSAKSFALKHLGRGENCLLSLLVSNSREISIHSLGLCRAIYLAPSGVFVVDIVEGHESCISRPTPLEA